MLETWSSSELELGGQSLGHWKYLLQKYHRSPDSLAFYFIMLFFFPDVSPFEVIKKRECPFQTLYCGHSSSQIVRWINSVLWNSCLAWRIFITVVIKRTNRNVSEITYWSGHQGAFQGYYRSRWYIKIGRRMKAEVTEGGATGNEVSTKAPGCRRCNIT